MLSLLEVSKDPMSSLLSFSNQRDIKSASAIGCLGLVECQLHAILECVLSGALLSEKFLLHCSQKLKIGDVLLAIYPLGFSTFTYLL